MSTYLKQPLASILTRVQEPVAIDPYETYRQVTVRLFHKGVVPRGEKLGSAIRTSRQWQVHQGQVLLSRIDARNGAIGIVPPDLDGAVVTNDFWAFAVNSELAAPAFLDAYFGTAEFVDACKAASEGTTNRVRLQPERFLKVEIPLPPLDEQRRIISRIEDLAAKVREVRRLRLEAGKELEFLWNGALRGAFGKGDSQTKTVESLCECIIDNLHSTPSYDGDDYPCIRSQDVGWGSIRFEAALRVSEIEFQHRIRRGEPCLGDIVYVREGDIGRCAFVDGSKRFCLGQRVMMFRPNHQIIDSHFMTYQFLSPYVLEEQVLNAKTGTTSHHVNIKHLRTVKMEVPPLPEQRRIVTYLDDLLAKVDSLNRLQSETAAELDALMPSILSRAFRGEL